MKKLICILLCILIALAAFAGCGARRSIPPVETDGSGDDGGARPGGASDSPRVYALQGDGFTFMPTVTLFENSNARLSQPLISSLGLFEDGVYSLDEDILTVVYGPSFDSEESISVSFTVSDDWNTLTISSTNLQFTKKGLVYKYQSKAAQMKDYTKVDGEKLTIEALREMAANHVIPTFKVFGKYEYMHPKGDTDSRIFDVEGKYTVRLWAQADTAASYAACVCMVENNLSGESFYLNEEGSTGQVFDAFLGLADIPAYTPRVWVNYLGEEELPWDDGKELSIPEYPGVRFTYTLGEVSADGEELFYGMPVWNVFLADLTNDGKPELCATVSMGSGIVDTHVVVYDYAAKKLYTLADRMVYDYYLFIDDGEALIGKGKLAVTRTDYKGGNPNDILDDVSGVTTELRLVGSEILKP